MVDFVITTIAQYASHVPQGLHVYVSGLFILLCAIIPVSAAYVVIDNAGPDHVYVSAIQTIVIWISAACAGIYAGFALESDLLVISTLALIVTVVTLITAEILILMTNVIYQPIWRRRIAEDLRKYHEQNPPPRPGYYDRPVYRREI
jgi:hypothetical protein